MTKTVFKYPLLSDDVTLSMPGGDLATVRHVAEQDGNLCLWVEVDPSLWAVERRFVTVGTGHVAPASRSTSAPL